MEFTGFVLFVVGRCFLALFDCMRYELYTMIIGGETRECVNVTVSEPLKSGGPQPKANSSEGDESRSHVSLRPRMELPRTPSNASQLYQPPVVRSRVESPPSDVNEEPYMDIRAFKSPPLSRVVSTKSPPLSRVVSTKSPPPVSTKSVPSDVTDSGKPGTLVHTVLFAQSTGPFLTYQRTAWTLNLRKEVCCW